MPLDFYYSPVSNFCRSVILTAKLLDIKLNLKKLDLRKGDQMDPEFLKLNPQHSVPTLVDDGSPIWESYAIIIYFVEKYGKDDSLYPTEPKKRALVNQRLFFDLGTLYRRFAAHYYPTFLFKSPVDPEKFKKVQEAIGFLDAFLEGQVYACGDTLTVADICLGITTSSFDAVGFDIGPYKNVTKWFSKIKCELPGFEEVSGKAVLTTLFSEVADKMK